MICFRMEENKAMETARIQPTDDQPSIICPYCGYCHQDVSYYEELIGGLERTMSWEMECGGNYCKKRFSVVCNVHLTFDTSPDCKLNKDEHVWVNERSTELPWGEFHFRECGVCGFLDVRGED
jgi:hypothetical protein